MPDEVYKSIANDLKLAGAQKIEQAPQNLKTRAQRKLFFDQVDQAGGIFFSGGDQNLALDIIDQYDLRDLFKDLHQQGIPFAGTSAGTALMPEYAMVGGSNTDKPRLREGLGLIEYFVDQHFIVRGREPRLKALVLEHQISGIGIDEGMAALVESGVLHSIGPTAVEILQIDIDQILKISLKNGQRLRLDFQNQLEQTLSVR
jgi:cyanophycinase